MPDLGHWSSDSPARFPSDEQISPDRSLSIVAHFEAHISESPAHLICLKETQFVPLHEMLSSLLRASQVGQVEAGESPIDEARADTGSL